MKIVIEGRDEMLKRLEKIQELSKELYREVLATPCISVNYTPDEESAACENEEGGRG